MKRFALVLALVFTVALTLAAGTALAASAKATAQIGDFRAVSAESWTPILTQTIHTSSQKDLFINVSLQSMLYTETVVKSKGGHKDTSEADARVVVRVKCDNDYAYPGASGVVFNRRLQKLSATLQGIINDIYNLEDLTEEEIELVLDTTDANAFNFILTDVGTGTHTITVEAKVETSTSSQNGSATAEAILGYGSMTVEEVRMIKGEDVFL